jgi:hypothetical protein
VVVVEVVVMGRTVVDEVNVVLVLGTVDVDPTSADASCSGAEVVVDDSTTGARTEDVVVSCD